MRTRYFLLGVFTTIVSSMAIVKFLYNEETIDQALDFYKK